MSNKEKALIKKSKDLLEKKFKSHPQLAIITGSGIKLFPNKKPSSEIKYNDIPIWSNSKSLKSNSKIKGHEGVIKVYEVNNKTILVFSGRKHLYQGCGFNDVTLHIKLLNSLQIKDLIITNAAGGINSPKKKLKAGQLLLIDSFIDLMQVTERGVLSGIIQKPHKIRTALNQKIKKSIASGTYCGMLGPNYETYSEILLLKELGANAVGMSTVPEIIAAKSLGINFSVISVISNIWSKTHKPTHKEVLENVKRANENLNKLISSLL